MMVSAVTTRCLFQNRWNAIYQKVEDVFIQTCTSF
jgi:hypothetical protein